MRSRLPGPQVILNFSPLESNLTFESLKMIGVLRVYKTLDINIPDIFIPLEEKWERDLGTLSEEGWKWDKTAP